jgi:O-antigen/teichoic acid export membrane protein
MLNKAKKYLENREFTRNVLTLMTGTTIAQAIPIAISPILTRIYTPDDFGVLALFMAITAVLGSVSCGKYEEAIVLPKNDDDAINLVFLGIIVAAIISLFLLIPVFFFNEEITKLLGDDKIGFWLYFIPVSTFMLGIYNSLNYYNIRKKKFKNVSVSQITKSSSLVVTQIGVGLIKNGPFGLILGQILSFFSGNFILYKPLKEKKWQIINLDIIKNLARKYKKFPTFSMPSIFINSINLNLANLLISSFFSITILGYYSLTQRIIGIPFRIIGSSFGQVYFQKATQEYHKSGHTNKIFIKTLNKLFMIALPIFAILFVLAEPLFAFVFGEEWRVAGTYAKILIPLAFIRFLSSTLSITVSIHQRQQFGLIINIILLITTLGVFYIGKQNLSVFNDVLKMLSLTLSIEYLLFIILYYRISKNNL